MKKVKNVQFSQINLPFDNVSPFVFIRHGETVYNKKLIVAGWTNVPLNKNGIKQADLAGEILKKKISIKTIVSSPLKRALHTAEIIGKKISKEVQIIPELKEMNFGVMEGSAIGNKDWIVEWDRGKYIEGAETSTEFLNRVIIGIKKALKMPSPVLIVSHGGVWLQFLKFLDVPFYDLPNSVPYYVDFKKYKNDDFFFSIK